MSEQPTTPEAIDVTDRLVDEALHAYGPRGGSWRRAKPARAGKLSAAQQTMFDRFAGLKLGFVSTTLIYAEPLDRLPARERQAFAALLLGRVLRVWRVQGAMIPDRSKLDGLGGRVPIGADGPYHYILKGAES